MPFQCSAVESTSRTPKPSRDGSRPWVLSALLTVSCAAEAPVPGPGGITDAGTSATSTIVDSCTDCSTQVALTSTAGTSESLSPVDAASGVVDGGTTDSWAEGAPLFSTVTISRVSLTLGEVERAALQAAPADYVRGVLEVSLTDGTRIELPDVGIRLKGKLGSARSLDQKAAFLIKTNEYVPGQKLLGLGKLALNNMVQDASMVHEQLAYLLFRQMGIAAPRTGYATVDVNGERFGLYALVEVVDNESFLNHWFGSDAQNLYEGAYGSDLETGRIDSFDQDRGDDVAFADLQLVADALTLSEAEGSMTLAAAHLDTEWYARFAATEMMLSHWDGYAVTRNNYFLYPKQNGSWVFVPWGTDQTFGDSDYGLWEGEARVQRLCTGTRACRAAMADAYQDLLTAWDELELVARVDALEGLIRDAVADDPRKEYSTESVFESMERTRQFLRDRPNAVRRELQCADPTSLDVDGDGASGCGADCDDNDATRYPGALEACNWSDDNCNGEVDEGSDCPACRDIAAPSGGTYSFCVQRRTFAMAEEECSSMGAAMVSIHSEQQQTELIQLAVELGYGAEFWIGLSDRELEGEFRWIDGSSTDFTNWAGGEPNDASGEDCAELTAGGSWNDLPCDSTLPHVCWRAE